MNHKNRKEKQKRLEQPAGRKIPKHNPEVYDQQLVDLENAVFGKDDWSEGVFYLMCHGLRECNPRVTDFFEINNNLEDGDNKLSACAKTLLFRMLFILIAEGRGGLLKSIKYAPISLHALMQHFSFDNQFSMWQAWENLIEVWMGDGSPEHDFPALGFEVHESQIFAPGEIDGMVLNNDYMLKIWGKLVGMDIPNYHKIPFNKIQKALKKP